MRSSPIEAVLLAAWAEGASSQAPRGAARSRTRLSWLNLYWGRWDGGEQRVGWVGWVGRLAAAADTPAETEETEAGAVAMVGGEATAGVMAKVVWAAVADRAAPQRRPTTRLKTSDLRWPDSLPERTPGKHRQMSHRPSPRTPASSRNETVSIRAVR